MPEAKPTPPPIVESKPAPAQANGQALPPVAENYLYWQKSGGKWADEYDQRKLTLPYYHLQEIMLAQYVTRHAERMGSYRVLEFGCGVGRHLRNLSRIPGVDAHGFDQSHSMVSGCLRWTGQDWIDRHVTIGHPTQRLPFADNSFDLVYTSEVLVHVRPEDLDGVLRELVRVARGQVLHLEPSPTTEIDAGAHSGCWNHDIPGAYARLGHRCESLGPGFRVQVPYRVVKGEASPWTWPGVELGLMRRLEKDLEAGLARERDAKAEARRRAEALAAPAEALEKTRKELADAHAQAAARAQALQVLEARLDGLTAEAALLRKQCEDQRARLEEAGGQRREQEVAHAHAMTALAGRLEQEKAALRHDLDAHLAELRRDAELWRRRAAEAEADRARVQQALAQQQARADHLAVERAAFIEEATRRLTT
jgi:SAM-dependent methyltransferase